jgi:hypothetical protein
MLQPDNLTEGETMAAFWRKTVLSVLILVGCAAAGPTRAVDALPTPAGEVVLTVAGVITASNDGASAVFDLAMLEALPQAEIETETPWTDGMTTFTGFRLADLLSLLGADGVTLRAHALNDYEVEVPVDDVDTYGVVVAYRMNGAAMPASDKGPLWIIYPYSDVSGLRTETYYARAIWNLDRLIVE